MSLIATHCRAIAAQRAKFRGRVPPDFCYTIEPGEWWLLHEELREARARLGHPVPVTGEGLLRRFVLLGVPVVMAPTPIRPKV